MVQPMVSQWQCFGVQYGGCLPTQSNQGVLDYPPSAQPTTWDHMKRKRLDSRPFCGHRFAKIACNFGENELPMIDHRLGHSNAPSDGYAMTMFWGQMDIVSPNTSTKVG